ncbi:hypothetical protein MHYP_G00169090 [Metynnis hypsauchen]
MSGLCREVVTLQLGHYSGFVGAHWWNLQDASLCYDPDLPPGELQSDVLFREGLTLGGQVTYTPRLIALDLKGSLQTLRKEGSLYATEQDSTSTLTWQGQIMTHEESPPSKNSFLQDLDKLDEGELLVEPDFSSSAALLPHCSGGAVAIETVNSTLERVQKAYRLEGSVRVWSDFLRLHLHPRTISVINQYNHDGESARLEAFGQGEALLQGSVLEELEDRLHFFVEECDYLQVVCAYGSVPFPMMQSSCLPDALQACQDALPWKPLSACPERADGRCFGQSVTLKGLEGQNLVSPLVPGTEPPSPLHCAWSGLEVLDMYIRSHYPSTPLAVQLVSSPSKLTSPFPQIFSPILDPQGLIQSQSPTTAPVVSSVPVLTCVQSSVAVGQLLAELQKSCSSLDLRRVAPSFLSQGLEPAELAESLEQLRSLAYRYRDDSGGTLRSSSEEEDD